jgi:membrane protein YqaA with SNARE-associated domain
MIRLTFEHPHKVWLYVLITTAGSTLGTMIIFGLARHWGGPWVERKMPPKRFRKVHRALEDYDVFAVAVPAMLPPPMPFKLFVLTAGIFEISWFDFIVSMFVGRGIRYAAEAYLAVHYGSRAWAYIRGHIWGLAIAATLLMGFGYWMGHVRHRGAAEAER